VRLCRAGVWLRLCDDLDRDSRAARSVRAKPARPTVVGLGWWVGVSIGAPLLLLFKSERRSLVFGRFLEKAGPGSLSSA